MNEFNYFISGVWKDSERITHVMLHKKQPDGSLNCGIKASEKHVVELLKKGERVCTITWKYPGWYIGAEVDYIESDKNEFLRTDRNDTAIDNLDNLISMKNIHNGQK
ncbi:DUF3892 domain-containing protein [Chryseobacterium aquaticum]|uniref:DUF3892 domain-containing protein n=1 Tax=Chryseobacterium aquaticum TaxID=452084 RepID=UPI003F6FAA1D